MYTPLYLTFSLSLTSPLPPPSPSPLPPPFPSPLPPPSPSLSSFLSLLIYASFPPSLPLGLYYIHYIMEGATGAKVKVRRSFSRHLHLSPSLRLPLSLLS